MRFAYGMIVLVALCGVANADGSYVTNVTVNVEPAQVAAENMARTGQLRHCGRTGGRREGIGFSSSSADQALRSCCYYGRYRIVEKGVARGPRGWFAVIRYAD